MSTGQPGLEVTPGKEFFDAANDGQPFLKNWDKFTYPPDDALKFHPMPPVPGAITVNIGRAAMLHDCFAWYSSTGMDLQAQVTMIWCKQ